MTYRVRLGNRLCDWHSSQNDPIYAVGSFYVIDEKYPDKDIVVAAIAKLETMVDQNRRMLAGEMVSAPTAYGKTDDLRKFAGYDDGILKKNIQDIGAIILDLKAFYKADYGISYEEDNQ